MEDELLHMYLCLYVKCCHPQKIKSLLTLLMIQFVLSAHIDSDSRPSSGE